MLGGTLTSTGTFDSLGTLSRFDPFLDTNPDAFGSVFSTGTSLDGFGPGDYSGNYTGAGDRVYWGPSGGSDEIVKPPPAVSRTHPNLVNPPHVGPGFAVQAAHGALATTDSGGFTIEGTGIETTFRPTPKPSAPQPSARTGAVAPPGSEATAPASSVGAQASAATATTDASKVSFMGSHSEDPGSSAGWGERSNMSGPVRPDAGRGLAAANAEFKANVAQTKAAAIELQAWKAGKSTATTTTATTVTTAPSEDVIAGAIELQPLRRSGLGGDTASSYGGDTYIGSEPGSHGGTSTVVSEVASTNASSRYVGGYESSPAPSTNASSRYVGVDSAPPESIYSGDSYHGSQAATHSMEEKASEAYGRSEAGSAPADIEMQPNRSGVYRSQENLGPGPLDDAPFAPDQAMPGIPDLPGDFDLAAPFVDNFDSPMLLNDMPAPPLRI